MKKIISDKRKLLLVSLFLVFFIVIIWVFKKLFFFIGGAFISIGILIQGFEHNYDFKKREKSITPDEVLEEVTVQNKISSSVKELFPNGGNHPLIIIVLCMDSRISTEELLGDTRDFYYFIRTAGSVIREKEMEMIELAVVEKDVKLVLLTEHSDCAAEKIAGSETKSAIYPSISRAIQDREREISKFLQRPQIKTRIQNHTLIVKRANIDTKTAKMVMLDTFR